MRAAVPIASGCESTHACGDQQQEPCFTCGCTVCGYTVDVQRLSDAAHTYLAERPNPDDESSSPRTVRPSHARSALARLRGLICRTLTCRGCGRMTHGLCARHPLEPRPWVTPVPVSAADYQRGLSALHAVLQCMRHSKSDVNKSDEDVDEDDDTKEGEDDVKSDTSTSSMHLKDELSGDDDSADDHDTMPPKDEIEEEGGESTDALTRFPSSPLPSTEAFERVRTSTRTAATAVETGVGGASPAACPPRPSPSSATRMKRMRQTRSTTSKSESPGLASEPFCCSLDCALHVELRPNPFFDADMSERYAREAHRRLGSSPWTTASSAECVPSPGHARCLAGDESDHPPGEPAALQVWYEAWMAYFAEDCLLHGRFPPFFPPAFTDADERVLAAVARILTPAGQAQRLCGLDPSRHPVGSVFAVPDGGLWDGLRLADVGMTTTFVREQLDTYVDGAITARSLTHQKRPRDVPSTTDASTANKEATKESRGVAGEPNARPKCRKTE